MLTEKQDASFIKYWLDEFIRLGGSIPNEFVCDMSAALLSAGVQAFGMKNSMSDYLNSLFNILNGVRDVKPTCFIRIDIAHFIKDVAKCDHLKNVRLKHRDFLIRSVALMIKMRSLTQIRDHILSIMVHSHKLKVRFLYKGRLWKFYLNFLFSPLTFLLSFCLESLSK